MLTGVGAPASSLGALGNFYIDTTAQTLYGPKTSSGWPAGTPLIVSGSSGPQASVPCPPGAINFSPNPFPTDAGFNGTPQVTFTPKYWGDFYMLASVADTGAPPQTDRQVIKVTVLPRLPVITYTGFPTTLTYNTGINLRPLVSSDSKSGASPPVLQPIVFSASGSCHMAADGDNLVIDRATVPITGPADCIVTVHQDGNEIYAPKTDTQAIFIDRATQAIVDRLDPGQRRPHVQQQRPGGRDARRTCDEHDGTELGPAGDVHLANTVDLHRSHPGRADDHGRGHLHDHRRPERRSELQASADGHAGEFRHQ